MANIIGYETVKIASSIGLIEMPALVVDVSSAANFTVDIPNNSGLRNMKTPITGVNNVYTAFTVGNVAFTADGKVYVNGVLNRTMTYTSGYCYMPFNKAFFKCTDGKIVPSNLYCQSAYTSWFNNLVSNSGIALGTGGFRVNQSGYASETNYETYDFWREIFKKIVSDDPYSTNDNQTPSGGYGDFNYTGDDDLPPSLPTLSAAQVGFVSLWNPSQQEMKDLADYLWTGTFDLTNFKKLFTDPMECILSVGIVPVTPTTGAATEIVFGGSSHSGVNAKPISSQFVTVDLGKVHINGQSASALDYSPYVKVSIFLPYCGTYALDADDVMDADVALEYHIDIYTGACVAYLTITRTNSDGSTLHSTLYQFTGNCLASIPITGNDHSQFIQSMLFMGAAVAATVATSGAGAPAIEGAAATGDVAGASAVNAVTASSAVNSVMSMKPNVLRSGNLSSTAGLLGKQKPSITVTWPNLCRPDTEYKLLGMPVHKSGTLSDFAGFTIVSAVHVENILCTEIEKQMIEQMLYKGVMV